MGREKEYRQCIKYRVSSARRKTVENQLAVDLMSDLGMSEAEAMLLSHRMSKWLLSAPEIRGPNQILVEAAAGRETFVRNGHFEEKKVKVSPFDPEDLDLQLEFGLGVMQLGRNLRLVEEAYSQDALLSAKQIGLICNITPTSLSQRLKKVRAKGIWVPVMGLSKEDRRCGGVHRSTWVLKRYLEGSSPGEVRREAAVSAERFRDILAQFGSVAKAALQGDFEASCPEEAEWANLAGRVPRKSLDAIVNAALNLARTTDWADFSQELRADFGLSPVKVRAVFEVLRELRDRLSTERADGEVIYWAVSSTEPAGKPLEVCRLVPVRFAFLDPSDTLGEPENRLSGVKFRKVLRYATQAKFQGGYLSYADLGYLLGIHTEAIRRLIEENRKIVVPLRGLECDIGRGVTHRRRIVELYLQMYTETEIVARTGHSYEAIENYIDEFAAVLVLSERGLAPSLIRRVLGRSMRLVKVYLELVREYSKPEYFLRLERLRKVFLAREGKKGGLLP